MTLALIAGRGACRRRSRRRSRDAADLCDAGSLPDRLSVDVTFRLETLGPLLIDLGQRGVTEVCFCGALTARRWTLPHWTPKPNRWCRCFKRRWPLETMVRLQVIKQIFEQTGFAVRGADELVPDLVALPGVLSEAWPTAQMRRDAARGEAVLAGLAPLDIGQACVIGAEQVLGVEAMGGTAHLLDTLPPRTREAGDPVQRAQNRPDPRD